MIPIISLLVLIMSSHVVVSQYYTFKKVGGAAVGAAKYSKILSFRETEKGTIKHGECLQVRERGKIIYNFKLWGPNWQLKIPPAGTVTDAKVIDDLNKDAYPAKIHRSVWVSECKDTAGGTMLIGNPTHQGGRGRRGGASKTKTKGVGARLKATMGKRSKPFKPKEMKVSVLDWKFKLGEKGGKALYHVTGASTYSPKDHFLWEFKSGQCIYIEDDGFCLNADGKWNYVDGGTGEYEGKRLLDDDEVLKQLHVIPARYKKLGLGPMPLWVKKELGARNIIFTLNESGGSAADAYIEYEDKMDGFALEQEYDELLAQFEYDVEIEEAREKKAMAHLDREKYDILHAKNRKNKYLSSSSSA